MRALFIIDSLEAMAPYKDTSLDLMVEGAARGHEAWIAEGFHAISTGSHDTYAKARPVRFADDVRDHKTLSADLVTAGEEDYLNLSDVQAIFIRNDPPFGMEYLSLCLQLAPITHPVWVNPPAALLRVSEKLAALNFPQYIPETIVTYAPERIAAFLEKHGKVVLKPAYFGAGTGIRTLETGQDCEAAVRDIVTLEPRGPVIAQRFLPEVVDGDTRVMMINGQVVGAIGRKPAEGEFRANVAVGGKPFQVELSAKQAEAAATVGAFLNTQNVLFAGLDFIGDHLIEINVTSPTLVQELRRAGGINTSQKIWEAIEQRL